MEFSGGVCWRLSVEKGVEDSLLALCWLISKSVDPPDDRESSNANVLLNRPVPRGSALFEVSLKSPCRPLITFKTCVCPQESRPT